MKLVAFSLQNLFGVLLSFKRKNKRDFFKDQITYKVTAASFGYFKNDSEIAAMGKPL